MPDDDQVERLRAELRAIARRREEAAVDRKQLAIDTRSALRKAKGVLPITEVARLIGLERSSLYQTYGGST